MLNAVQSEHFGSFKNFSSNTLCRAVKFQVKLDISSPKKKLKPHFYQRHTRKIDITSLINANPDPEFVSTRGRAGGTTPTGSNDAAEDPNKNADGKGRGRGRRRGSAGPGESPQGFVHEFVIMFEQSIK